MSLSLQICSHPAIARSSSFSRRNAQMDNKQLKHVIEAALLAAGRPLSLDKLQSLFDVTEPPARQDIRAAIVELQADCADRGLEVVEVASGFRAQIRATMAHQLDKLWEERPPRYSRALLETLSIIAYRQPVTRGEIEDIRGVVVSTNIVRTLLERNWVKVVGHRDVPGKPAMFGTTKEFLDYFGLKKLDDLPPLSELKDFDNLNVQLDLQDADLLSGDGDEDSGQGPISVAEALIDFGPDEPSVAVDADSFVSGNVASLEQARAAARQEASADLPVDEDPDADGPPATIVPLKQP